MIILVHRKGVSYHSVPVSFLFRQLHGIATAWYRVCITYPQLSKAHDVFEIFGLIGIGSGSELV